jgi:hypothetical protein
MSNTPVPVSIAGDVTHGGTLHAYGVPHDSYDLHAWMDWKPGGAFHSLAKGPLVAHKGQALVLEPHNLGPLLPHLGEAVVAAVTSSRKPIGSASTVLANGKPVACVDMPNGVPMMLCGWPFKFPTGMNETNSGHSVFVGMNEFDRFRIWVVIASEAAKDLIGLATLAIAGPAALAGDLLESTLGIKNPAGAALDMPVDFAASVALSAKSNWERPIEAKITIGSPVNNIAIDAQWKVDGWSDVKQIVSPLPGPAVVEKFESGGIAVQTPVVQAGGRVNRGGERDGSVQWIEL